MLDLLTSGRRSNRCLQALIISLALNMAADGAEAGAADHPKGVQVPSVTSTGQRNGVTAGLIQQLNQTTVLPTLVRGPQLEKLKSAFTGGAQLYRSSDKAMTDAEIDEFVKSTDAWVNDTFQWLNGHVSNYAAERFFFRPPALSYTYNMPGEHAAGYVARWGYTREALAQLLNNLDQLMRDPSIYPEDPKK